MRKLISTILALCMVLCLLPVTAAAEDANPAEPAVPTETVKLDVGAENGENDEYKIMDDAINIRKDGVVYELTGTTDKKLQMWGSNSPDPVKTFYLRLNGATINGGITIWNPSGAKLVVEVVDGTDNTVSRLYAVDLTITGAGTIRSGDLGSTQSKEARNLSKLYIKDTKIVVDYTSGNPSEWNGACVLDGSADVTYTSSTEYSALKLAQTSGVSHSLTMKGNAKLRCLQANASDPAASAVDGLAAHGAPITLQDNAYLEAQGRAGYVDENGDYTGGSGIGSSSDITVKDNATIDATAYGAAVSTWGNVKVLGGKIIAKSTNSNGIYTKSAISISNGATVEAEGYWPAVYGNAGVSIANSTVKATSTDDAAIFSKDTIEIRDSVVEA